MTRYTFDPRIEHTLAKGRRHCRTFSVGIEDSAVEYGGRTVARIKGPSEHTHAIRAAARAYCDHLNAMQSVTPDSRATVVLCKGNEARVAVNGRVVAQCSAFDSGLNEAWAGVIADALNASNGKVMAIAKKLVQAARTPPKGWEGDGQPGFWHSAALDAAIEELAAEVKP